MDNNKLNSIKNVIFNSAIGFTVIDFFMGLVAFQGDLPIKIALYAFFGWFLSSLLNALIVYIFVKFVPNEKNKKDLEN